MQYSPKLKGAMEEIKQILTNHDIAAVVVLHTPGFSEYLVAISPSYSCASFVGDEIRVKAKLVEDFKGNKEEWTLKVSDTSNMFNLMSNTLAGTYLSLSHISQLLDKKVGAEHNNGGHTSHNRQNN